MGKCIMNCSTCGNSSENNGRARDSDGYCYMWKEEPEGECFQHTAYKDSSANALSILASILANIR